MSFDRPAIGQRPSVEERQAGKIKIPGSTLSVRAEKGLKRGTSVLARKAPLKASRKLKPRMSPDAKVQDAMLGRGRCWLVDSGIGSCTDGYTQRSHIVPQALIREVFEFGVWMVSELVDGDGLWWPILADTPYVSSMNRPLTIRPLQQILDDTRNIVPTCPNHNRDGAAMVDALEVAGYPRGFDDFKREYRFEFFDNRYWKRVVS